MKMKGCKTTKGLGIPVSQDPKLHFSTDTTCKVWFIEETVYFSSQEPCHRNDLGNVPCVPFKLNLLEDILCV